jgi:serine/threonine-protein kinase HipA
MTDTSSPLPVTVGETIVGNMTRNSLDPRGTSFRYQGSVEEQDAMSLVMPVRLEEYRSPGIIPVVAQNMPEGALREQLMRVFAKTIRGFDEVDLLRIVGPHQLGRVKVGQAGPSLPETSVYDLLKNDGYVGLFEDLLERYAQYSGLSGAMPKVLIADSDSSEFDRVTHRGATHIVKAWREGEYDELAANEYFCMLAAEYSGLKVPPINLSANGKLLIVERFDVLADGRYLGMEDLNALNGKPNSAKYDGSYEGAARQLKAFLSPENLSEGLEALFKMVALSTGIRNGDQHLKNLAICYESCAPDSAVWISPAFDMVTTVAYQPRDHMALELAGSKNWPKHRLLADFGRRSCGLTERRCSELMVEVLDGMSKARGEMIAYMQDHDRFKEVGTKMLDAWNMGPTRSLMPDNQATVVDLGAKKSKGPRM